MDVQPLHERIPIAVREGSVCSLHTSPSPWFPEQLLNDDLCLLFFLLISPCFPLRVPDLLVRVPAPGEVGEGQAGQQRASTSTQVYIFNQRSGSGFTESTCFWASRIQIHYSAVWILLRILLSSSKNSRRNLDSSCFVTSFGFFIYEKWCKYTFKK